MVVLALSVLCSSILFVIFKLYDKYNIQTLYAIIVNYLVACMVGLWLYQGPVRVPQLLHTSWAWGPLILGVLFVVIFTLMAKTAQVVGVSVASLATKISLVIPVVGGVLLYQEQLSAFQVIGIFLALCAVYLASLKQEVLTLKKRNILLPVSIFLGSGIIDTIMKYFEKNHLTSEDVPLFSAMIFGAAALSGCIFVGIQTLKKPFQISTKDIIGGIILGIPNYFSVFFMIRALQYKGLSSAVVFTLNHTSIIVLTTLLGIFLFKEKISFNNWIGLALALLSIVLVALF